MREHPGRGLVVPLVALAGWLGTIPGAMAQQDQDRVLVEARANWDSGKPGSHERAIELLESLGNVGGLGTPIWTAALGDPSPSVRTRAIRHFQWVPRLAKETLRTLTGLLKDPEAQVRDATAWVLAQHGRECDGSIGALVEALHAGPDRSSPMAAFALASIGRPAVPALVVLLKSGDPAIRRLAIAGLNQAAEAGQWYQAGSIAKAIDPHLQSAAGDPDPTVRVALASLLVATRSDSPPVLSALGTLLRDPSLEVRLAVVTAIGRWSSLPIGLRPAYLDNLKGRDPRIRLAAAGAIPEQSLAGRAVLEGMLEALRDPDEKVRAAVAGKLSGFRMSYATADEQDRSVLVVRTSAALTRNPTAGATLRAALEDRNPRVRAMAAHLLPAFPDRARAAIPRLIDLLKDSEPNVRGGAAEALGLLGPAAREAVRPLLAILANPDGGTDEGRTASTRAAVALAAIGGEARAKMLRVLFGQLNCNDDEVRQRARVCVVALAPGIVRDLIRALADPRSPRGLQRESLLLLMMLLDNRQDLDGLIASDRPDPSIVAARPVLRTLAHDEDPEVETAALWLLGCIDPENAEAPERFFEHVRSGLDLDEDNRWDGPILQPAMIPTLIQGLRDPDPAVRIATARLLTDLAEQISETGPDEEAEDKPPAKDRPVDDNRGWPVTAARALLPAMEDPDVRVRWQAAEALGVFHVEAKAVIPALREMMKTGTARVPAEAARFRMFDDDGQPYLLGRSKKEGDPLRIAAIQGLAGFGREAAPAVPDLIRALRDEDRRVRWCAAEALGQIGPEARAAVPALIEALRSVDVAPGDQQPEGSIGDGPIRLIAAIALGRIGPEARAAVPELIAALNGPDSRVRDEAAQALGRIGLDARASVPTLLRLATREDDDGLVESAAVALCKLGPAAVPELVAALRDREPRVRATAVEVLGELEDKKAVPVPALTRCLLDRDAEVRGAAAAGLMAAGRRPETVAAIPLLLVVLGDDDPAAANAAHQALDAIGGPVLNRIRARWDAMSSPQDEADESVELATVPLDH